MRFRFRPAVMAALLPALLAESVAAQTIIYRHSIPGDAATMVQGAGGASGGGASGSGAPSGGGSGSGGGSPLGGGAANQAPVAYMDILSLGNRTSFSGSVISENPDWLGTFPTGVDYDPDGDPIVVSAVDGDPSRVGVTVTHAEGWDYRIDADGTIVINGNGALQDILPAPSGGYTPTSAFTQRQIHYTLSDGALTSSAEVRIGFIVTPL